MPNATPKKIFIATDGDETSLNCKALSNVYVTLQGSHPNFSEIYSALLAAQHSERNVTVRIREGTEGCLVSYVTSDN